MSYPLKRSHETVGAGTSDKPTGVLAWVTDPHLNFLDSDALTDFYGQIGAQSVDGLVITGDIAEADSVIPLLNILDETLDFPIYFVLGNHDFYGGSITETRMRVRDWAASSLRSTWMPAVGVQALSERTGLIGHGGWGDGQIGDFMNSGIRLNDYRMITELTDLPKAELFSRLKALGEDAAAELALSLKTSLQRHDETILITHVPPFLESCWYQGQAILSEWTPHFTCGAVGAMLKRVMSTHPDHMLRVYCGHTHSAGVAHVAPNITVFTGSAEYNAPHLQASIPIDADIP